MITVPRCTTVETAVRLWAHECSRVFYDRLINREDQQWFEDLVVELLPRYLKVTAQTKWHLAAHVLSRYKYLRRSTPQLFVSVSPTDPRKETDERGSCAQFLA